MKQNQKNRFLNPFVVMQPNLIALFFVFAISTQLHANPIQDNSWPTESPNVAVLDSPTGNLVPTQFTNASYPEVRLPDDDESVSLEFDIPDSNIQAPTTLIGKVQDSFVSQTNPK